MEHSTHRRGLFPIVITAILSVAATLLTVFIVNGGVIFFPGLGARYDAVMGIGEVISTVNTEFYGEQPTDEMLISSAAKAIVSSLNDPYAQYFTADEYDSYRRNINGSYSGLGIMVTVPDDTGSLIVGVYEDSPAAAAGLKTDDIITHVNDNAVAGIEMSELSDMLSGADGDTIKLTVLREGSKIELQATFGAVIVHNVHHEMIDSTGYILIDMFSDSAPDDFDAAINDLKAAGMDSLVIDLRNNPGGSLNSVIAIADSLLNEGTIVSIGRSMTDRNLITYEAESGGISVPVAVLVNENSASASEILAAAVKENGIGAVIGTQTYGKGIVQTSMPMRSGGWLKLTTDAYFTPDGNNIHGSGVTPDIIIEAPEGGALNRDDDIQLWTAIDYVMTQLEMNAIAQ